MPAASRRILRQGVLVVLLLGAASIQPAPIISEDRSEEREADSAEFTIAGFIELNSFSDRGIAQFTMGDDEHLELRVLEEHQKHIHLMAAVERAVSYVKSLPRSPLSVAPLPQEWPFWRKEIGGSKPESMLRAHIVRFSTMGLTELFQPELQGLLDSPLAERPSLMKELLRLKYEAGFTFVYLSAKDRKRSEMIAAAVKLRRLSSEFDRAIAESLNESERERVAALIDVTAPIWMQGDKMRSDVPTLPFGSKLLAGLEGADD